MTAEKRGKRSSKITDTDEAIMKFIKSMKTVAIIKINILNIIDVAEPVGYGNEAYDR